MLKKRIGYLGLALLTAISLTLTFDVPDMSAVNINSSLLLFLYKMLNIFAIDMQNTLLIRSILSIVLYVIFILAFQMKKLEMIKCDKVLAGFLALMYMGGRAFAYGNSLSVVFQSSIRLIKFGIMLIGFYLVYLLLIRLFFMILNSKRDSKLPIYITKVVDKHTFLSYFITMMFFWLIQMLLRFPGIMSYDNRDELAYFFGYQPFSSIQPVFHTWLFGTFVNLGLGIGSANIGLFLFVLIQSIVLAMVLSFSLVIMKKNKSMMWIRIVSLLIFCFTPYFAAYTAFPIKDMFYISFFLLFVMMLMQYVRSGKTYSYTPIEKILFFTSGIGMMLFRSNGIYIYCISGMILLILWIINNRKVLKKIATDIILLLSPIVCSVCISHTITTVYQVQQVSTQEVFSITYQQIGRYARDYEADITNEDRQAIAAVLDYENLARNYNSMSADPIKSTFNNNATKKEIAQYLKAWFHCFTKHPICYLEATWNQNYYIFMPDMENMVSNRDCYVGEEIVEDLGLNDFVKFSIPEKLQGGTDIMFCWYSLLANLPIIGLFSNIAFYIILFIILLFFMRKEKMKYEWLPVFPVILSFLFIILAPQILHQPRYAFPIVYTLPILIGFYQEQKNKKE